MSSSAWYLGGGNLVSPARPPKTPSLAVFVRLVEGQAQFVTIQGDFYVTEAPNVAGAVMPGCMPAPLIHSVTPHLPTTRHRNSLSDALTAPGDGYGSLPISVTSPIIKRLTQLEADSVAFRRAHQQDFDAFYDRVAHDHEQQRLKWSQVARLVFDTEELSPAAQLAIYNFHAQREHGVLVNSSLILPYNFQVVSRQQRHRTGLVVDWARRYQETAAKAATNTDVRRELRDNPLTGFIAKAQRLILTSRQSRSPTTVGMVGPSKGTGKPQFIASSEVLTADEEIIVDVLNMSYSNLPFTAPIVTSVAVICRAIGAYPNVGLDERIVQMLLQEMGFKEPWCQADKSTLSSLVPGNGVSPELDRLHARAAASAEDSSRFSDSLAHLRKDWGQLPVYCIDSADTVEVDDGISIETSPANPDHAWIHVYIANPTAYFSRDHVMAEIAERMFSTIYRPNVRVSMLPPKFVADFGSLGPDRPAMTISSLVGSDGVVLDRNITFGIVRNVIRLTHAEVRAALGTFRGNTASLTLGGRSAQTEDPVPEVPRPEVQQALPDLRRLRHLSAQVWAKRSQDWPEDEKFAMGAMGRRREIHTDLSQAGEPHVSPRPGRWTGDPCVQVKALLWNSEEEQQRMSTSDVVNLCMVLAGESAARWCADRKVPVFYLAATPHPLFPARRLQEIEPDSEEYAVRPAPRLSSTPERHVLQRFQQYMRVTSPLRRYVDLINQWQIQAWFENDLIRGCSTASPNYPFPASEIESRVNPMTQRQVSDKAVEFAIDQHWMLYALYRAHHFPDHSSGSGALPRVWDFRLGMLRPLIYDLNEPWSKLEGALMPFGIQALLLLSERGWEKAPEFKRGMFLPVELVSVDVLQMCALVRAVGPPSVEPTIKEPFHVEC